MGSLAPRAPLASPGWARLVPQGSQARLDHLGNRAFVGSQGYEGTRASGGPPGPLDSLGPQALLSLGNQAPRGCQDHQDLGGSQGLRGNLGPQVIEASRGIMGWVSQGCLGPQGKGVPLDPLACLAQLAWANQVWMGFLGPLEIRVSLAFPGCQDPGGSQGQWAQRGLLGWMVWGPQGQQECQGHRAQQGPKENQGPGVLLASQAPLAMGCQDCQAPRGTRAKLGSQGSWGTGASQVRMGSQGSRAHRALEVLLDFQALQGSLEDVGPLALRGR